LAPSGYTFYANDPLTPARHVWPQGKNEEKTRVAPRRDRPCEFILGLANIAYAK